jgi:hypothetical protein
MKGALAIAAALAGCGGGTAPSDAGAPACLNAGPRLEVRLRATEPSPDCDLLQRDYDGVLDTPTAYRRGDRLTHIEFASVEKPCLILRIDAPGDRPATGGSVPVPSAAVRFEEPTRCLSQDDGKVWRATSGALTFTRVDGSVLEARLDAKMAPDPALATGHGTFTLAATFASSCFVDLP